MATDRHITLEELEETRETLALIIDAQGPEYLPLFIRVNDEIEQRKNTMDMVAQIAAAAKAKQKN